MLVNRFLLDDTFNLLINHFLCMYVYICVCLCEFIDTTCVQTAHTGRERVSDLLELESEVIVSHHVGSGNQIKDLCESRKLLQRLNHLFCHISSFLKHSLYNNFSILYVCVYIYVCEHVCHSIWVEIRGHLVGDVSYFYHERLGD